MNTEIKIKRLYQVWDRTNPDVILCAGSKTKCLQYMRDNNLMRAWKNGKGNVAFGYEIDAQPY